MADYLTRQEEDDAQKYIEDLLGLDTRRRIFDTGTIVGKAARAGWQAAQNATRPNVRQVFGAVHNGDRLPVCSVERSAGRGLVENPGGGTISAGLIDFDFVERLPDRKRRYCGNSLVRFFVGVTFEIL